MKMKYLILLFCSVFAPFAIAADSAQHVQTNVNVQNKVEASNNSNNNEKSSAILDPESATTNSLSVQQDQQQESAPAQSQPPNSPQQVSLPSASSPKAQQPLIPNAAQNVQLLKEANSQYQYQINSRYEEKTKPVYDGEPAAINSQYIGQPYPYISVPVYPYYKEDNQYQELGNGQRRSQTNVAANDGVRSQYENQDQSSYTHHRSQSYSEYGKGESFPEYNTYAYKRIYY